ncbi:MAG: hypothetical protein ACTSUB_06835 [Candidatus Thorarchaeota archaeon]
MPNDEEKRKIGPVYRSLSQDLYATDFHADEMGIRQAELWRAKSRQYSKDAEIIGKIDEARLPKGEKKLSDKEKVGFIIVRNSLWDNEPEEISRRFIAKLFSNSGGWLATIEEMVVDEISASYSSKTPLLSFSIITKDTEIITSLRQVRVGAMAMEAYSFFMLGPDKTFEVFKIEQKRIAAGHDFKVVNLTGDDNVAEIDSKLFNIGGNIEVKIKDPVLAENDWFCRILQCFSIVVRYRSDIKKKIAKTLKSLEKTRDSVQQHRHEISLLVNPRKLTFKTDDFEDL